VRHASSGTSHPGRWIGSSFLIGTVALVGAVYYYDSRSVAHEHVVMPVIRAVADPEQGHKLAVKILSAPSWARPKDMGEDGPALKAELMGMPLDNPVGIAAGFDKDAQCIDGLFDLGFAYVEVGSVCPQPQSGNPLPRFFRLEEDDAAINRYGFNSLGHGQALGQLRKRLVAFAADHPALFPDGPLSPPAGLPRSLRPGHILAVNLGKNKTSPADSDDDYLRGVRTLGPYADVVVINISSPNTPGLRALQSREPLERLLRGVVAERDAIAVNGLPKVAVKVTCDLSEDELADVASAVRTTGVDGVIVSNTTIRRDELGLQSENAGETGGLSGRPLFPYALAALKTLRPLLPPNVPIIGAGGVWDGADALAMARAGASMVQVYTAFGYRGVGTPRLLKDEIAHALVPGASWEKQVGADYGGASGMKWDAARVAAEGAKLRAEARELGNVLTEIREKMDTHQLAAEADEALAHLAAMNAATLSADGTGLPEDAVRGLVHPAVVETPVGVEVIEPAPAAPQAADAAVAEAAVAIIPADKKVAPVVVEVEKVEAVEKVQPSKPKDAFAEQVHSGSRRLV
jgi:dihydroorotate dehydrogenase